MPIPQSPISVRLEAALRLSRLNSHQSSNVMKNSSLSFLFAIGRLAGCGKAYGFTCRRKKIPARQLAGGEFEAVAMTRAGKRWLLGSGREAQCQLHVPQTYAPRPFAIVRTRVDGLRVLGT